MFAERHRYIAQSVPVDEVPSWSINRTIKTLMGEVTEKYTDHPQPFLYLADSEPYLYAPWVDSTRAKLAFGQRQIPILKKSLCVNNNDTLVAQALCTLGDLVHDPEKACEALRLNCICALVRLMHHHNIFIRQRCLMVLRTLAMNPYGRSVLTNNKYIMNHLRNNMFDWEEIVRGMAYRLLKCLASNWFAVSKLVELGFHKDVMKAIKLNMNKHFTNTPEDMENLLETLDFLMEHSEKIKLECIRYDLFDINSLLTDDNEKILTLKNKVLNVFVQILKLPLGRQAAVARDFTKQFITNLNIDQPEYSNNLLSALMFTTIRNEGKKDGKKMSLIEQMLDIISVANIPVETKRRAIKILSNMAELPIVKKKLQSELPQIVKCCTGVDKHLENELFTLLKVTSWKP